MQTPTTFGDDVLETIPGVEGSNFWTRSRGWKYRFFGDGPGDGDIDFLDLADDPGGGVGVGVGGLVWGWGRW